jgi:hypothetical protein
VQYSQGQCAVQSAFLFTSPCEQTSSISLQIPVPSWTQGLTAVGSFSCGVGESSALQSGCPPPDSLSLHLAAQAVPGSLSVSIAYIVFCMCSPLVSFKG